MSNIIFKSSTDLLIGQYDESPRLRGFINLFLDVLREEAIPALDRLRLMRDIDEAEGVFLDRLGSLVGLPRPATTNPTTDARFGFDGVTQARGFDQEPFAGDAANAAVYPLPDAVYRRFIKARAVLVLGDGTTATFARAVRHIDPGSAVRDNRDMSIRVVTERQPFLELADTVGALPRTAGVRLTYQARGQFGFDEAGEPFDQGPFAPV